MYSKWIKIQDKLPEYDERVIVLSRGKGGKSINIGIDSIHGEWSKEISRLEGKNQIIWRIYKNITHWMYLPEPPGGIR